MACLALPFLETFMRKAAFALAVSLLATATMAQAQGQAQAQAEVPTIAEFLTRVRALYEAGESAAGTPAMQRVRDEVAAAGREIRRRQQAEQAAGTTPTFCIPAQGSANDDLFTHLVSLPAAQQTMPLTEGFASYVRSKYPCPRQ